MSSSSSKHEAHVYHRSQWRLLQYLFIFLSIHANISLQDSSLPPGSKDDQICSSASLSSLHGASAPRIVIVHPTNGEIVTDYRGGGRGMQIFIRYEVQDLPCGGSSRILLVKDEIPMETMPLPGDLATAAVVDVFFRLTPGHYRLLVVVQDRAGHEKARESVSLEVEVPDYARHVRVMGTHDTLAAILGAILKNRSGAYLRFGDGDIQLSSGLGGAEQMQAADTALMFEAQAALAMQGEHVFKGLMVNSELFGGIEEGMCDGNHLISDEIALGIVEMASPFWKPAPISDVYGNAALAHAAATYPELAVDFLVQLRRARPVAFVGNLNVEPALLHALFGRQVVHIKSPPTQAYSQLDRIHAELLQVLGEAGGGAAGTGDTRMHVVVTFMGTSGLVLQHRLRHLNLFTFDFGSLLDALSEWKFRGGLAPQDAGKPGGAGKQGAQPAWIFYSGFSRHKRRELLRLFCLQIRHEPDPCSPELYSDGQKQSLVQDSSVGADASPHVEDVEKEEPALAQAEQEEELLVIVQPRGSVTKDVFNFTSPLPLVLHVPASCDADTIEVHVDGFLKTPYLSAWRTRAAGEVARGVEGEGVSGNGQWLECSMGKGVEFEGSPDGVMLEGFHSIEVSVMCSGGVGGGRKGHQAQQALVAEGSFEVQHLRQPFDVADPAHGMEECLVNSTLMPASLMHLFDPALHAHIHRRALQEPLPTAHCDVILDVGGNIGVNTRRFRTLYPHLQLHVFEPLEALAMRLEELFAGDKHVTVHAYGLSRRNTSTRVRIFGNGLGGGSPGEGSAVTSENQCEEEEEEVFYGAQGEHGKCVRVRVRGVEEFLLQQLGLGLGRSQSSLAVAVEERPSEPLLRSTPSLHLECNCEGCEFELMETLLELGYAHQLASLTVHTHKSRAFGAVEQRWCDIQMKLRETHDYVFGAPWVLERWLLRPQPIFS